MRLTYSSELNVTCQTLWRWHERPLALWRLLPKRIPLTVQSPTTPLQQGDHVSLSYRLLPFLNFQATFCIEQLSHKKTTFTDVQTKGPFYLWRHKHQMRALPSPGHDSQLSPLALLNDKIEFKMSRFPSINGLLHPILKKHIKKAFIQRHHITSWDTFWFENYPLKVAPIIISFKKGHHFGKTLHYFFAPFIKAPEEYHYYKHFQNTHKPQVVINALEGALSPQAEAQFTKRLCEINPSKCVVLYKGHQNLAKLSFIEHYCKYPVFFECSSLINMTKSVRTEVYAAKFYKTWLSEEELLAAVWLALYDHSYSDSCKLERSLDKKSSKNPLYSSKRYSKIIDQRNFTWSRFLKIYT